MEETAARTSDHLETGIPADKRSDAEMRVYRFLTELGIPFERADHPAAATMEDCREADRLLCCSMCKNLFLCNRQKTAFYLLLLRGEKPFVTKEISARLGVARLSFADAEHMEAYLGLRPGAVSVMGLMNDTGNRVQLLIDSDLLQDEYLGCHPCVNTASLRIRWEDMLSVFLPAVKHVPVMIRV